MNPKFTFTKEQSLKVLKTAFYLNQASNEIIETNGMLGMLLNSMAIELIDQTGYLDYAEKSVKPEVTQNPNLSKEEKEEIESIISDLKEINK